MPDARCPMPVAGCPLPDAGCRCDGGARCGWVGAGTGEPGPARWTGLRSGSGPGRGGSRVGPGRARRVGDGFGKRGLICWQAGFDLGCPPACGLWWVVRERGRWVARLCFVVVVWQARLGFSLLPCLLSHFSPAFRFPSRPFLASSLGHPLGRLPFPPRLPRPSRLPLPAEAASARGGSPLPPARRGRPALSYLARLLRVPPSLVASPLPSFPAALLSASLLPSPFLLPSPSPRLSASTSPSPFRLAVLLLSSSSPSPSGRLVSPPPPAGLPLLASSSRLASPPRPPLPDLPSRPPPDLPTRARPGRLRRRLLASLASHWAKLVRHQIWTGCVGCGLGR